MTEFKALFGIDTKEVKKNCILMPLLPKGILAALGVKKFSRGKLYGAGNTDNFTLIYTGLGPALTGDAVLYLKGTSCRNLILFGSCGLVKEKNGLTIASLVSPVKCFAQESFSQMLLGKSNYAQTFSPDRGLLQKILNLRQIKKVTCATIASLKLEQGLRDKFVKQGIEVVEMECSAFFSSADFIRGKAVAVFYITDIIKKKPFYRALEPNLKSRLDDSIKDSAGFLGDFIRKELR